MTTILDSAVYRKRVERVMGTIGFQSRNMSLLTNENGETPLVIALPSENMQDVLKRVRDAGGSVNIVVAFPQRVVVFPLTSKKPVGPVSDIRVAKTTSVGMFIIRLRSQKLGSSIRLVVAERDFEAEYQATERLFEYAA